MKYAHYDNKTNEILGYYDDSIHQIIPTPNISLSNEEWSKAINKNATHINLKTNELYIKEHKITEQELKQNDINELKAEITEQESLLRKALLIGNEASLKELRDEYKDMLAALAKLQNELKDIDND
ncbi:hypothetical protein KDD93_09085 [Campylobacter sp. faydin G-24]|uniref:Uncharacterized protein n=2 Tax=Campylobacter anatolicus TaxID=2829105 RepID=A0ABS5HKB9_9BACT|nr:hypothetical protein [Campylobacter anatolicus]MBR8464708.1 hypothetical protein [Campylobacter anatolicus]